MTARLEEYLAYHEAMAAAGDIDPAYPLLRYLCDRFELTYDQRLWLAWLYGCTYNAATVYLMYNRFPDHHTAHPAALESWWHANRYRLAFTTDRRWIRSRNQWPGMAADYLGRVGVSQRPFWEALRRSTPGGTYRAAYAACNGFPQFGRFALFLYLEAVHVLADVPMEPDTLDLRNAESSRNGLAYALSRDDLLTGEGPAPTLRALDYEMLNQGLETIIHNLRARTPGARVDVWNVETTLCAYKKYKRGHRYVGYYLDRQQKEIAAAEQAWPDGVCWDPLWDWRADRGLRTGAPGKVAQTVGDWAGAQVQGSLW